MHFEFSIFIFHFCSLCFQTLPPISKPSNYSQYLCIPTVFFGMLYFCYFYLDLKSIWIPAEEWNLVLIENGRQQLSGSRSCYLSNNSKITSPPLFLRWRRAVDIIVADEMDFDSQSWQCVKITWGAFLECKFSATLLIQIL